MLKIISAIYRLQTINPQGVSIMDVNRLLGVDESDMLAFFKEIYLLHRCRILRTSIGGLTPLHKKRYLLSDRISLTLSRKSPHMAIKEHTQRLLLVIRKIQSRPYITFDELQQEITREMTARGYEPVCSRNTLQRDIREIRTEFGVEVQYSRSRRGYFINAEESDDIEQFLEPFEILNSLNADGGVPDFILAEKHRPLGTKHLFTLIEAIKNCNVVDFSYTKYSDGTYSDRKLEPNALKQCRSRWYVIGRELPAGAIKTFGLDRIENIMVSPLRFKRDPSIDIAKRFEYSYGIYSDVAYPIEDIILSFDAEDAGYLKSSPLHPSQEITEIRKDTMIDGMRVHKGEFVVKLRVRLTLDFLMEIISRSWSLRVISPESLREKVCTIYRNALSRNDFPSQK